eukprot:ANDGO_02385.mRNA.1 Mannosyl-oligosaccharide 1
MSSNDTLRSFVGTVRKRTSFLSVCILRNKLLSIVILAPFIFFLVYTVSFSGGGDAKRTGPGSPAPRQQSSRRDAARPSTTPSTAVPKDDRELSKKIRQLDDKINELEDLRSALEDAMKEVEKRSDALSKVPVLGENKNSDDVSSAPSTSTKKPKPPRAAKEERVAEDDEPKQAPAESSESGSVEPARKETPVKKGPAKAATTVTETEPEKKGASTTAKPVSKKNKPKPKNGAKGPSPAVTASKNAPWMSESYQFSVEDLSKMQTAPERALAVKRAMQHAWKGFKDFAWGADELHPLSKSGHDWVPGGAGFTIIDALDTLWLMGMEEEFQDGVEWIRNKLSFDRNADISFFETTIRCLGGLLSAYEMSGEEILLERAVDLGERLAKAFNSPSGAPFGTVNLASGAARNAGWTGGNSILAEVGTVQLEFRKLAQLSGRQDFEDRIERLNAVLFKNRPADGMYPIYVNTQTGTFQGGQVTLGALGDSFFEYLIKQWILSGKKDTRAKQMYDESAKSILSKMIKTTPDGLMYVAEWNGGSTNDKMDHLACFTAGMLVLGAEDETYDESMRVAAGIANTCHEMYARQASGLAPEFVNFRPNLVNGADFYILRPEAVEAFFYMYRATEDEIYQEWAWEVFNSLEKWCRVPTGGYVGVRNVGVTPPPQDDLMQSFFLAETLKYLYLIFAPEETLDLEEWVFNTEAHPLRVME